MSTKVKCSICEKELDIRGIHGHMRFAHQGQVSEKIPQTYETVRTGTSENTVSKFSQNVQEAQLAEKVSQLAKKEDVIAQLQEEICKSKKIRLDQEQQIEELEKQLEENKAWFAEIPKAIDDFPALDKAEYFTAWLKCLTDKEKVRLAELTGFGPLNSLPAKEDVETIEKVRLAESNEIPAKSERDTPHFARTILLTCGGKAIGRLRI